MLRAPSESEIDGKRRDEKVVVDSHGYRAGKVDDAGRRRGRGIEPFYSRFELLSETRKDLAPVCPNAWKSRFLHRPIVSSIPLITTFRSIERHRRNEFLSYRSTFASVIRWNDGNYRAKRSRKSACDIWKTARHVAYGCELTASEKQYRRQFYQGLFSADRTQPIH